MKQGEIASSRGARLKGRGCSSWWCASVGLDLCPVEDTAWVYKLQYWQRVGKRDGGLEARQPVGRPLQYLLAWVESESVMPPQAEEQTGEWV